MKDLEELKQYYSNATKEEIIFDNYQDMLRVVELQQENEQLKADYGNIAQVERDILLQQKEELIKHCENEIFSQKESIELLSNKKYADIHIGKINAYKEVLSKLKERE